MNVFIVIREIAYEGADVVGVFEDEGEARRLAFKNALAGTYADFYVQSWPTDGGSRGETWYAPRPSPAPEPSAALKAAAKRHEEDVAAWKKEVAEQIRVAHELGISLESDDDS